MKTLVLKQATSPLYSEIERVFETASLRIEEAMRGVSWRETQTPLLGFLPPSNGNSYYNSFHHLMKNGETKVVPRPPRGTSFNWEDRPDWQLQFHMAQLREVTTSPPASSDYARRPARSLILRPNSLLLIRYPEKYAGVMEQRTGEIHFPAAATGHDRIAEIEEIERDFPGRFDFCETQ